MGWESLHMLSLEAVHRNKQRKLLEESKVMQNYSFIKSLGGELNLGNKMKHIKSKHVDADILNTPYQVQTESLANEPQ